MRVGDPLAVREADVLRRAAMGETDEEIGRNLRMAPGTVQKALRRIRTKLGAVDRTHAVALAYRGGLLTVPEDAAVIRVEARPRGVWMPQGTADALEACARAAASGRAAAARRFATQALALLDKAAARAEADNRPKDVK